MTFKEMLQREKYVAIHAQTWQFRMVKYLVFFAIGAAIYTWSGWTAVAYSFLGFFVFAIVLHSVFRWKTKAWTQSWGPYKKLKLPN